MGSTSPTEGGRGDICVLGSGISAGLAAAYLRLKRPDLTVRMIRKPGASGPIIGESLTEFATYLMYEIGMGHHLERYHATKYCPTFYFKQALENPGCRTYSVHESERVYTMPSHEINREIFDRALIDRCLELGVEIVDGTVQRVEVAPDGEKRVLCSVGDGSVVEHQARWVIDATGRRGVLAKQLDLRTPSELQRHSFWVRVEDVDTGAISKIDARKAPQHSYDSYYATHHFFGHGKWYWVIPIREGSREILSIGVVGRADLSGEPPRTPEEFLELLEREHPVLADCIRSGTVTLHRSLRNYMYESKQTYSSEGWFLVGDAADTVDPLYSAGIALTAIQIKQIAEMISLDEAGQLTEERARTFEAAYKMMYRVTQDEIANLYPVMHDPMQCHARVSMAIAYYFDVALPSWLAGYITDPQGARWLVTATTVSRWRAKTWHRTLAEASSRRGGVDVATLRPFWDEILNWDLPRTKDGRLGVYLSHLLGYMASQQRRLLKWLPWPRRIVETARYAMDLSGAFIARATLGRWSPRRSRLFRMFFATVRRLFFRHAEPRAALPEAPEARQLAPGGETPVALDVGPLASDLRTSRA